MFVKHNDSERTKPDKVSHLISPPPPPPVVTYVTFQTTIRCVEEMQKIYNIPRSNEISFHFSIRLRIDSCDEEI